MSSHYLDFSSCGIVPGFCKSGHIYCTNKKFREKKFCRLVRHGKFERKSFVTDLQIDTSRKYCR